VPIAVLVTLIVTALFFALTELGVLGAGDA
jgi:Flp pilus assembly protein protease CpaA